ncbi:MAG: nucleotidyltransferase family protein [Oscillospiraceae bacterium]|nr:nucleotidyltransferase family protein [Oscillospiraceae bacterium]
MEKESRYLLHLLGAYIRNREPEVWQEINWRKLTELAHIHNLLGTLGYMTMTYPVCPDRELCALLRSHCMTNLLNFANRGELADNFSQTLSEQQIDHIIMKGFVLREFYPVPELRTFGDIDLVIRPEDRGRCHALMQQLGFQVKTDWEPVYSYLKDSEFYEIHTELLETDVSEKADYRSYFRDLWAHVTEVGEHRYQFVPEYHFLYMLVHIAKHVTGSGAGLRMYLDVAVFMRHYADSLDWERISRELEKLKLAVFANTVLTLVQEAFGINSPMELRPIPEQTLDSFLEFTVDGGIFGRNSRDSGVNSLKDESRSSGEISRAGTIVRRLFPSARSIQSRYTYLQDKPWLLPAAWVHRLIRTKDKLRDHALEVQNILSADQDEVQRLNTLYEQIGL